MAIYKGFIKNWNQETILPITRAELVLDTFGNIALNSGEFEAGKGGSKFGLISVDDLAKIKGTSGSGQSLSDLYEKLGFVNGGLYVGNTQLNFYDGDGNKTPIRIMTEQDALVVGVANNIITFDLKELGNAVTSTKFVKGISVDKYGRVTSIVDDFLTNSDIPEELEGKKIKSSTLDGCLTENDTIANNDRAIVNKKYVDSKFLEVEGIATGALTFGGSLSTLTEANNALNNSNYLNHFFKVVTNISGLKVSDLTDPSGFSGTTFTAKAGDTLIVYQPTGATSAKFVYIPSANDDTFISVKEEGKEWALENAVGDVQFSFSKPFTVSNSSGNLVKIVLNKAEATKDGYLSKEDYQKFAGYEDSLKVSFEGDFNASNGYKLGTLTVGTATPYTIYGKKQISNLELVNGTTNEYNPILKFTETDVDPVSIEIKGINGITAVRKDSTIELAGASEVKEGSEKYLEIDNGYQIGVTIGKVEKVGNNNVVSNGLTDYAEFAEFRSTVYGLGVMFEEIEYSLADTTKKYYYGSAELAGAIAFN